MCDHTPCKSYKLSFQLYVEALISLAKERDEARAEILELKNEIKALEYVLGQDEA